jgi:hypothetical protein
MKELPNKEFDVRDPQPLIWKEVGRGVGKSIIIITSTGCSLVVAAFLSGLFFDRWQGVEKIVWVFAEINKMF